MACGDSFTLVLTEQHQLYSFGKVSHGRLGLGAGKTGEDWVGEPQQVGSLKNEKVVQISAGCRHAACVTDNGKVYAWGFNFYEQLGVATADSEKDFDAPVRVTKNLQTVKVKQVSCGYFHTGALV